MKTKSKANEVIGQSLRDWRKKFNLTQYDVSVDLDINFPAYQAYEEGRAQPSLITMKKLANLYQLPNIECLIDFSLILNNGRPE